MALMTFKATSRKLGQGLSVESEARGFKLVMDEPVGMGGTDTGMSPVEAILTALGSCQCIVAAAFARMHGIAFQEFWVELEGDLDTDGFMKGLAGVRPGFQEIRFTMHIRTDAPKEQVAAFQAFIEGRCPVGDSLLQGVPMRGLEMVVEPLSA